MRFDRDLIALVALHGMLTSPPEGMDRQNANAKKWAEKAYDFADALLKAKMASRNEV